jgi:hypothetical protein
MPDYGSFRQQLDRVLRTQDVNQVQAFLIAEHQWDTGTPADPEFAMWVMIAGSPALTDLHGRAGEWLAQHGHEAEAQALLGKGKPQQKQRPATSRKGHSSAGAKTSTQQRVKRTWTH